MVGAVAAGLGHIVRFTVLQRMFLLRLVAFILIVQGIMRFDSRLGLVGAGILLIVLFHPIPPKGKAR